MVAAVLAAVVATTFTAAAANATTTANQCGVCDAHRPLLGFKDALPGYVESTGSIIARTVNRYGTSTPEHLMHACNVSCIRRAFQCRDMHRDVHLSRLF